MRRSLRIRDRIINETSSPVCRFCDHSHRCCSRSSSGPLEMIGEGDGRMPSTSRRRIEDNVDPREFLPNYQDENLIYQPINLTISASHRHCAKLLTLIISVTCASIIVLFINPEYPNFLSKNKSAEVGSHKKPNFDLASCYSYANEHARLAHVNKHLKFVTQKLETLYRIQVNMQKQTHDIESKIGNFKVAVNSKIEEALILHNADKVGIFDYALESAGGYIISTPETYGYSNIVSYDFLSVLPFMGKVNKDSNPRLAIQSGTLPGECFAFKGQHGRIQIGLSQLIDITAVTIEHTSPYLVESINSAPKDFVFYGLNGERGEVRNELGCFTYRINKNKPLQMFPIVNNNVVSNTYKFVEFNFLTNYGNPTYTCVYRVRVHGNRRTI